MDPAAGRMRVIVMRAPASRDGVERPMNQNQTGPEPLVAVPGQLMIVLGGVLLSRTLAGAVPSALSGLASGFGMGAGRFPVAVTTETTGWAVRDNPSWLSSSFGTLFDCLCLVAVAFDARCVWLVGGLGVDRIVDALRMLTRAHPWASHARCVCGVWGCCCLCWPISTSQLINRCRSSTSGLSTQ